MKIGFISDLHLDVNESMTNGELTVGEQLDILVTEITKRDYDYFFISGDVMNSIKTIDVIKELNERLITKVYYVLGNHDIWSRKRLSYDILRKYAEDEYCLVNKVLKIKEDVSVVGIFSWYDGSLDTLGNDKSFYEINHHIVNDAIFTRWGKSNYEVSEEMLEKARGVLKGVNTENIILLNHFVPSKKYVKHKQNGTFWNTVNGFMGTTNVMELVKEDKRIKYLTYGHTHFGVGKEEYEGVTVISNPLGYKREWEEDTFKERLENKLIEITI